MKITVHTFVTADGVMQSPGAPDEDASGGFTRGGWLVPYADEAFGAIVDSWFGRSSAILLGRGTYEAMYPYWSEVTDPDNLVATRLNGLTKYVVSTTLRDPVWAHTEVVADDVLERIRGLKDACDDGELQVHGSWQVAQTLQDAGLVDEWRLLVFPVLVGRGKRLFADETPASGLTLVETSTTPAGVVSLVYRPTAFDTGAVVVEDGRESTA